MRDSKSAGQHVQRLSTRGKKKQGSGKNKGRHCSAAQLLLHFNRSKDVGQEQGPKQGQPKSPGGGQRNKEHKPCCRSRRSVQVSVIRAEAVLK